MIKREFSEALIEQVSANDRALDTGDISQSSAERVENGGAGVIVLPNVVIGDGAVVTAGSVVTQSVPPMTLVQGNPAEPVARCGLSLTRDTTLQEFTRNLLPL